MPIDFLAFYGLRPGSFRVVVTDAMVLVERDDKPGNVSFSRCLPSPIAQAPIAEQHMAISPGENLPCALVALGNVAVPVPAPPARPHLAAPRDVPYVRKIHARAPADRPGETLCGRGIGGVFKGVRPRNGWVKREFVSADGDPTCAICMRESGLPVPDRGDDPGDGNNTAEDNFDDIPF